MKSPIYSATIALLLVATHMSAATGTENILINEEVQIPGAVLDPGKYTVSVEDRLYDRAIVKITRQNSAEDHLVLAVPALDIKGERAGTLILFKQVGDAKPVVRGWTGLEFVYPKQEAAKLVGDSGQTVLAIDPASEKMSLKLSAEEMKMVTLWSLSPEHITAENRGLGVKAVKFSSASESYAMTASTQQHPTHTAALLAANAKAVNQAEVAHAKRLPKTASNTYTLALWGAMLMTAAAVTRMVRTRAVVAL